MFTVLGKGRRGAWLPQSQDSKKTSGSLKFLDEAREASDITKNRTEHEISIGGDRKDFRLPFLPGTHENMWISAVSGRTERDSGFLHTRYLKKT